MFLFVFWCFGRFFYGNLGINVFFYLKVSMKLEKIFVMIREYGKKWIYIEWIWFKDKNMNMIWKFELI